MDELGTGTAAPATASDLAVVDRTASLDRRRSRALELTPAEKVARRRNRRWMVGIAVGSIVIIVLALIASSVAESNSPNGPSITVQAGYAAARDGYFTYAVPSSWKIDQSQTDATGDLFRAGSSGFAGESIRYEVSAPALGEKPPAALEAFATPQPQPYQLTDGHQTSVPGATVAYAYTLTRPGFSASVIDAWDGHSAVEIWLEVGAPPAVSQTILASLRG